MARNLICFDGRSQATKNWTIVPLRLWLLLLMVVAKDLNRISGPENSHKMIQVKHNFQLKGEKTIITIDGNGWLVKQNLLLPLFKADIGCYRCCCCCCCCWQCCWQCCCCDQLQKTMFSKSKSASKLLENNPILQYYEVGRLFGNGGPEGVWKIYEGVSKADGRVSSIALSGPWFSRNMPIYYDIHHCQVYSLNIKRFFLVRWLQFSEELEV